MAFTGVAISTVAHERRAAPGPGGAGVALHQAEDVGRRR